MPTDRGLRELADHFRAFGAHEPERWAHSQIEEALPQWGGFVFLRQAWRNVIAEDDTSWIDLRIDEAERRPRDPGASIGPALKRLLAAGIRREDIAEVVRVMQWRQLAGIMHQIDDPDTVEYPTAETPRVSWALFETDEELEPLH